MENMQNIGNMHESGNIENMLNIGNMHESGNIGNMQNIENMQESAICKNTQRVARLVVPSRGERSPLLCRLSLMPCEVNAQCAMELDECSTGSYTKSCVY